jgi:hypothetical protein
MHFGFFSSFSPFKLDRGDNVFHSPQRQAFDYTARGEEDGQHAKSQFTVSIEFTLIKYTTALVCVIPVSFLVPSVPSFPLSFFTFHPYHYLNRHTLKKCGEGGGHNPFQFLTSFTSKSRAFLSSRFFALSIHNHHVYLFTAMREDPRPPCLSRVSPFSVRFQNLITALSPIDKGFEVLYPQLIVSTWCFHTPAVDLCGS